MTAETPANPVVPGLHAWQAFAGLSGDLFLLLDSHGRIQWVNPTFERVSGWSAAQAARRTLDTLIGAKDDNASAWPPVASALADGQPVAPVELPWRSADGRLGWGRLSAMVVDGGTRQGDGAPARALAVCLHDLSEARRLTELLDMTQEFGRLGVWEREIPSGHGHWDPQVFRFFGFDPREPTPDFAVASQRIHDDDRARIPYQTSTARSGRYEWRFRIVLPDGRIRRMHSQWRVDPGVDGKPARAIGIMVDDTEVYELARSHDETVEELRLAMELAHICVWRQDLRTNRVYYNDRTFQVLGLQPRPEGLALDEVRDLIHPDDLSVVVQTAEAALTATTPLDMAARYRRSDGTWRDIQMRRVVRRAEDGTPLEFLGVALDMTEQLDETRRVRDLAARLELTASAARLGLLSRDLTSGRTEWNAQLYQMHGRTPELGPPTDDEWLQVFVHPQDRAAVARKITRLAQPADDAQFDIEFRVLTPGGDVRWLSARARRMRLNSRDTVLGVMMDVTDQVRTQAALRTANARAALAARSAGFGIWEWNPHTGESSWDDAMWQLRGRAPRAQVPTTEEHHAMYHPDDRQYAREQRHLAITEGRARQYHFRVVWPDGSVRWLASRVSPIHDEHGRIERFIGVNWDVTDAVDAETQRREKLLAQRESQAKSRFLARMSHELRTPLNAVIGFAQLLRLDEGTAAQRHAQADHILAAGQHLLSLINDVLDVSRLETEHTALVLESVPLDDAVAHAMALVAPLARSLAVRLEHQPGGARVLAQSTRLHQVLLNLLSNAIKYNRRGGSVTLSTRVAGDRVTLSVRDTGRGLDADQLDHLFEPFNRLGVEREGIEGTGIGLSIVKGLLERMGGVIEVRSEPGVGSEFTVTLARTAEHTAVAPGVAEVPLPTEPPARLPAGTSRSARLLYIEDNALNVLLVEELMATCRGLSVRSEPDGARGVARALTMQPDLVLVDMQLPDFDGLEVLRRLRADPATAAIPCVALSANAMPEDIARAKAAGFDDYITKPIDFAVLVKTIDDVLAAHPARRAC